MGEGMKRKGAQMPNLAYRRLNDNTLSPREKSYGVSVVVQE